MALTFSISNGDVVMGTNSGKPTLIGNDVNEDDIGKAKIKNSQDIKRCLSLELIQDGTTAGLQQLVGTTPQFGSSAISSLVNRRIRTMFSSILREQAKRPNARSRYERFQAIAVLRVYPYESSRTSFRFKFGVKTTNNTITNVNGLVG